VERGYSSEFAAGLASTLDWWAEAGVDCLVADEPREWLRSATVPPPLTPSEVEGSADNARRVSPQARSGRADLSEPLPDQLALFHDWLRASDALPYSAPSAPRICPAGDPAAGLMIMTAMPSTEDCAGGTLLSGPAGRLFDRMLAAIGRSRETVYLAGLSCIRPAGGRLDPAGAERCAEIARHHVALAAPKALLLLGDGCARALLGQTAAQARGKLHRIDTRSGPINAVVTLGPDYLLAQPAAKARAWADLQLLMEALR